MNSFHTIAIPHKDILEGRLTLDTFAADLWEVAQKRGPDEYKDAALFFEKTYITEGLQNLLDIVERRINGKGGDPVIQLQTPFGGGKTHALIAIYHKAAEWNARQIAIAGTSLNPNQTLWGILEQQLTGHIQHLTDRTAPGKEKLRNLLIPHQPIVILIDELLEYITRAAGVKIEESTLAAQSIAFMQELTELAASLEKLILVVTLPSSATEHYDESAELYYQKLQKVTGRVEKIYTPVQDNEIAQIVRRRLFSRIDETKARQIVNEFVDYADKESILPENNKPADYRQRFTESYPFMPEVIDTLYHRWGSFPGFQRTRGVLRLLSLVIYTNRNSDKPYISLADFDLKDPQLRQELLKHSGQEFNSIIDMDISGVAANAKKVDPTLGDAYRGLNLSVRTATAIFLYSFSGGHEQGVNHKDIKRNATTTQNPAAVISEVISQLEKKLFYLQTESGKYFFSSQANLNRILMTHKENVTENQLAEFEHNLLTKTIGGSRLKIYIWADEPSQIPDSEELKLIILKNPDAITMENIRRNKGQTLRVFGNTLIFVSPVENEKIYLYDTIRQEIAYRNIEKDPHLNLTREHQETVKSQLKKIHLNLDEAIRRAYRVIQLPARDGFKKIDLGVPTYGGTAPLDKDVYERLRADNEILETIAPIVIREKYLPLPGKDYVYTQQLYDASLKTPGEPRFINRDAPANSIKEGVRTGMFGLGELQNNTPRCRYYKEECTVAFEGNEIIIRESICLEQEKKVQAPAPEPPEKIKSPTPPYREANPPGELRPDKKVKETIRMKFRLPRGKVANMLGVINYLQSKFQDLEIELTAAEGEITQQEYEDKILEAFSQSGIQLNIIS